MAKKGTGNRKISDERIKKLEVIGFVWVGKKVGKRVVVEWDLRFEELKAYKDKHGHCNVPNKYPANPVSCVGYWLACHIVG